MIARELPSHASRREPVLTCLHQLLQELLCRALRTLLSDTGVSDVLPQLLVLLPQSEQPPLQVGFLEIIGMILIQE